MFWVVRAALTWTASGLCDAHSEKMFLENLVFREEWPSVSVSSQISEVDDIRKHRLTAFYSLKTPFDLFKLWVMQSISKDLKISETMKALKSVCRADVITIPEMVL